MSLAVNPVGNTRNRRSGRTEFQSIAPGLLAGMMLFFLAVLPGPAADGTTAGPGVVHRYGRLQVKNGQLSDQRGNPVQLRGMSSHDLKQFPFTWNTVSNLVNDWQVSVIRAAMYTDSYGSSYIRDPR